MTRKILTVSIAAYNVEKYIADCLDSFGEDASEKIEVIIVNDGSTDGTLEIARDYELRRPQTFKVVDKPNGGYGSTINAALREATGKYFRFLDGDDWMNTEILEQYLELLEDSDEEAVYTPYVRIYEDGGDADLKDDLAAFGEGVYPESAFLNMPIIAACSLTYKTSMLREIDFKMTERCFYTDVEFACIPFVHVKTMRVSKLPLYRYRIGRTGQSVSISGIERHYKDLIRVCERLLQESKKEENTGSEYFQRYIVTQCTLVYSFLTRIRPSAERKASLKQFDGLLKCHQPVYEATARNSKKVRILRGSAFIAYRPLCRILSGRHN